MKHHFLLLSLLLIFFFSQTYGQTYQGNLYITSQAQADTFPYKVVTGHLEIDQTITDFTGFDSLEIVGGNLRLDYQRAKILSGFNALTKVEGLSIAQSDSLIVVTGFNSLDSVMEIFNIWGNLNLDSVTGFDSLKYVGYRFSIVANNNLHTIGKFGSLVQAGDPNASIFVAEGIFLSGENLNLIQGFPNLSIWPRLQINSTSPNLTHLDFFKELDSLPGYLELLHLPGITHLHDFDSIQIAGRIKISLDSLKNLSGFSNMTSCSLLDIESNPSLKTINQGFDSLINVIDPQGPNGGGIYILHNPLLLSIGTFHKLANIYSTLSIVDNPTLKYIVGFEQLITVNRSFFITQNPQLEVIPQFPSLESVPGTAPGNATMTISGSNLTSISGFNSLQWVNGKLGVHSHPYLFSISGFENLNSTELYINGNPILLNLCGLLNYYNVYQSPSKFEYTLGPNAYSTPGNIQQAVGNGTCKLYDYQVTGSIYDDLNDNCIPESVEPGLSYWILKASGPTGTHYAITDTNGEYEFWLDTATYTVELLLKPDILPLAPLVDYCDTIKTITVDTLSTPNVIPPWGIDLPSCPFITTEVHNAIFRRCFTRTTSVSYQNIGNDTAFQAMLYVRIPDLIQVQSAQQPFSYGPDSVLIFQLGTIAPGGSGSIALDLTVICTTLEHLGVEQCLETWVESPSYCLPISSNNWSGASLETRGRCLQDSVRILETRNHGTLPMGDSVAYRILSDFSLLDSGMIHLPADSSVKFYIPSSNNTVRLELNQVPNHPFPGLIASAIEGCTTTLNSSTSRGIITSYPEPRSRTIPSYTSVCLPIIGSYDPNDKQVWPTGIGPQQLVTPGSQLKYRIRFQNTGSDTAFTVRITDRLDPRLDQTTFSPISASHPYAVSFSGDSNTLVTFLFSNIMLPDSNVNEPESHGYIDYTISPRSEVQAGSSIFNFASIYFDFNPPIKTNSVTTNFGSYSPPISIPPKPTIISIVDTQLSQVMFSWMDISQFASNYLIQRSPDSLNFTTIDTVENTITSYTDSIPSFGKTYWYRVLALNFGGKSNASDPFTVYQPYPIPASPNIVGIDTATFLQPTISWIGAKDFETGYLIQRSSDSLTYLTVDSVSLGSAVYQDTIPLAGKSYWYRVVAFNSSGNSSPSDTARVSYPVPIPFPPQNLTGDPSTLFFPILSWDKPDYYESGFIIERSVGGAPFSPIDSVPESIDSYTDSLSAAYTPISYQVRSYNETGKSGPSNTITISQSYPVPPAPTNLSFIRNNDLTAELSWDDNSSFEYGYILEKKTISSNYQLLDTIQADVTTYLDSQDSLQTIYNFRVRAFNPTGNSPYSNEVTIYHPLEIPPSPANLYISSQIGIFPVLTWSDNSVYEDGFILERSENGSGFIPIKLLPVNSIATVDSSLNTSGSFEYRMIAFNSSGNSAPGNIVLYSLTSSHEAIDGEIVNINLYPNPIEDHLQIINTGIERKGKWELTSLIGQSILNGEEILSSSKRIDLRTLPSGFYLFRIEIDGREKTWKFQKI